MSDFNTRTGRMSGPPELPPLHNIPYGEMRGVAPKPLPECIKVDYDVLERRALAHTTIRRRTDSGGAE